jgi:hypothetical protein
MKQSIWRQRSASDVIDQHPSIAAGRRQCAGGSTECYLNWCWGPAKSNAVVGEPELPDSYTTSASKSKKESNTGFLEEQLKSVRYFCTQHFPPN